MAQHVTNRWKVGGYTFTEYADHGFSEFEGQPLYDFAIDGKPGSGELYPSLDYALVAAVGEKYTGPRRAAGSGTDTAAGWFMKMIGAENPV